MSESRLTLIHEQPAVDGPQVVFDHWVSVMRTGRPGPRPAFTPKRRKLLERSLTYYDLPTLLLAVDGCALSDFHMGQNSRGRRYDSLELIFRDAEHIERFAGIAAEAQAPQGDFDAPSTVEVDW